MALTQLYKTYFQKSKSFLYPVLGIRKGSYTSPIQTYTSWEDKIKHTDQKLLCVYDSSSKGFPAFQRDILFNHPMFEDILPVTPERTIIQFDFSMYADDWKHFLAGKYSKLSTRLKQSVRNYFGPMTAEYAYMESFLFPEKYFNLYTELLYAPNDVAEGYETLKSVGELINPLDLEKETLKIPVQILENSRILA